MARSVIFTVPLDPGDEMRVESRDARERPDARWRVELLRHARSRAWRWAVAAAAVLPPAAAAVSLAFAEGRWAGLVAVVSATAVVLVGAAVVGAVASEARGGARRASERVFAAGLAGGAVGLAALPAIAWATAAGGWGEAQIVPAIAVVAATGAGAACLGVVVGDARAWTRPAFTAGTAAGALLLVPVGLFAALVPATLVADEVEVLAFQADFVEIVGVGTPVYYCESRVEIMERTHTEQVAWVGLLSPLGWVVDAPAWPAAELARPTGAVERAQAWIRSSMVGPDYQAGYCNQATSLAPPQGVMVDRMERATPYGARYAMTFAALMGAAAWVSLSRRR